MLICNTIQFSGWPLGSKEVGTTKKLWQTIISLREQTTKNGPQKYLSPWPKKSERNSLTRSKLLDNKQSTPDKYHGKNYVPPLSPVSKGQVGA